MELLQRWLRNKTINRFLERLISVVLLGSEYDSVQYHHIYLFILICNLALTRLYTYIGLYHAKSK